MAKSNEQLLATAARDLIAALPKMTIKAAVAEWNIYAAQAGLVAHRLADTDYTRKAHLVAALTDCAAQLEDSNRYEWLNNRFAMFHEAPAATQAAMVEAAHVEALHLNNEINSSYADHAEMMLAYVQPAIKPNRHDAKVMKERAAKARRYSALWVGVVSTEQLARFNDVSNNRPVGCDFHSVRVVVTEVCKELINRTQWSA